MSRIARLIYANLSCLEWKGETLRFTRRNAAFDEQEHAAWTYFMTWGQEERLTLARRIIAPFNKYVEAEIVNWNSAATNTEASWYCFLLDALYELRYAIGNALSLPSGWATPVRKW